MCPVEISNPSFEDTEASVWLSGDIAQFFEREMLLTFMAQLVQAVLHRYVRQAAVTDKQPHVPPIITSAGVLIAPMGEPMALYSLR